MLATAVKPHKTSVERTSQAANAAQATYGGFNKKQSFLLVIRISAGFLKKEVSRMHGAFGSSLFEVCFEEGRDAQDNCG